jgi:leader peptidase (prepilin peptidase) / N-methyltransferase
MTIERNSKVSKPKEALSCCGILQAFSMDLPLAANLFLLLSAPFVGSFLDLLCERWPRAEPFLLGRSRCDHCGHDLKWRDLIPVASWIIAGGRCRYCGARVPGRHPIVEISALAIAIWSQAALPIQIAWIGMIFGWVLLALALIDLRSLWLPNALTLPLGLAGLLVAWVITPERELDHVIGAILGYAMLVAIAFFYRRYRGREGLGEGDPRLFGALGAWVGWQGLGTVLLYAGIAGLLSLLIQARMGRTVELTTRLSFGPYLCLGGWLTWLYGPLYLE